MKGRGSREWVRIFSASRSKAEGGRICDNCGLPIVSFTRQCGACGSILDDSVLSHHAGSSQQTSSQMIYEAEWANIHGASSSSKANTKEEPEPGHEEQQRKDSLSQTHTREQHGALPTSASRHMGSKLNKTDKTRSITDDFLDGQIWVCGSCGRVCRSISLVVAQVCPSCSHERDYAIGCCKNPGESFPDITGSEDLPSTTSSPYQGPENVQEVSEEHSLDHKANAGRAHDDAESLRVYSGKEAKQHSRSHSRNFSTLDEIPVHPSSFRNSIIEASRLHENDTDETDEEEYSDDAAVDGPATNNYITLDEIPYHPSSFRNSIIKASRLHDNDTDESDEEEDGDDAEDSDDAAVDGHATKKYSTLDEIPVHPSSFRNSIIEASRLDGLLDNDETDEEGSDDAAEDGHPTEQSLLLAKPESPDHQHHSGATGKDTHKELQGTTSNSARSSYTQSRRYSDSSASSYARSELSSASLASSATNLSIHSRYPVAQIEQATRELVAILRDGEGLSSLYVRAAADVNIGAPKLERNLRRFFKTFSEQLKQEAGDTLELQASRLVGIKARAVARLIVQKHSTNSTTPRDVQHFTLAEQGEQSSDNEVEPQPVNEELLQNMDDLRQFLTGGEAFQSLQKQIRSFVIPKATKQFLENRLLTVSNDEHDNDDDIVVVAGGPGRMQVDHGNLEATINPDDQMMLHENVLRYLRRILGRALTAMTFEEPAIQPGFTRLEWKCKCGQTMSGDVFEHVEGGVSETIERIRLSTGSDVVATPSGQGRSTQARTALKTDWIQETRRKLSALWQRATDRTPGLPHHSRPTSTSACVSPNVSNSQRPELLLMSCIKRSKYFRELTQDNIDGIDTDQAFFYFLRKQIRNRQWRIRRLFSFEAVRGIHFVKFELRASGYTKVHDHKFCPTTATRTTCDRIPPKSMVEPSSGAEYRCEPHGPPKSCPPFFSDEMMHWLTSPKCIDPKATAVLNQIPKRTRGELKGTIGQPAEGWGIHFQEGWDFDLLIGTILLVFLLGSFLFAVLWSYFKLDVQGAFGVSSYMVTAAGIFVAWCANRAGKMG